MKRTTARLRGQLCDSCGSLRFNEFRSDRPARFARVRS